MKRGGFLLLFLILVFLLLQFSLVSAAENDTEQTKVDRAYSCLSDKVSGKCSSLSLEEKTFSVLSLNQCKSELLSDSSNSGECWSSSSCTVKDTAQAVLALSKKGTNTDKAQNWLLSQNTTPSEILWYLEIEASEATSCTISYGSSLYTININEEKKIDVDAGPCLVPAPDNYWLRVSSSCYNEEFKVSCDKSFLTTTLFQKQNSATIHVSEKTSSAAAGGTTTETVDSSCFADSGSCNYEASLWAALTLDALGKDISPYLPYLITLASENQRYLPDAFLYAITNKADYKTSLLSKQKSNSWWMESGDKFYDTALALYPLTKETSTQKTNAKTWLLSSQDSNGCWENNLRNTAFILASIWPKTFTGSIGEPSLQDCEEENYYCASSTTACTTSGGSVLSEFDCPGSLQKCCTVQQKVETCSEQGGEICSQSERCIGGAEVSASDLRSTEICCAGNGYCGSRTGTEDTDSDGEEPEEPTTPPERKNYWWVWTLLALIILVVLGIIFRDSLRMLWFKMKSGGSRPSHPGPRPPPHFPPMIQRPIQRIERRILVPQHAPAHKPALIARAKSGAQKELDEVLRKLKEMSK